MRSISRFLLISLLASVILISTAVVAWSYRDASHEVEELFDAELAQMARVLQSLLKQQFNRTKIEPLINALQYQPFEPDDTADQNEALPQGHKYEKKLAFRVWNNQGDELLSSHKEPELLPFNTQIGYRDELLEQHRWRSFTLQDPNLQIWLTVAQREDVRAELVNEIVRNLLLPLLLMIPLLAGMIWLTVNRGLAPLKRISKQVSNRSSDNLEPLDSSHNPKETAVLVTAINQLLSRLQQAFNRERRFSADAAHELRTPLAGIRIHAQNLQELQAEHRAPQQIIDGIDQMTHIVEQLLALSRLEHSAEMEQAPTTDTPITPLVQHCVAKLAPLALAKQQQLELVSETDASLQIHPERVTTLLTNLLENAIHYTPEQGKIELKLGQINGQVQLHLSDTGPGIPADKRQTVFERFYRLADQSVPGSGLGLAIVKEIAVYENMEITLSDSPLADTGLQVQLTFKQA